MARSPATMYVYCGQDTPGPHRDMVSSSLHRSSGFVLTRAPRATTTSQNLMIGEGISLLVARRV